MSEITTPLRSLDKLQEYRPLDSNYFDKDKFNIWNYLKVEMFGIGEPGVLEPPGKENIQNFFIVPIMLESLICLGCVVCTDAFLYVLTYLPIRAVFSLLLFLKECFLYVCQVFGNNLFQPPFNKHRRSLFRFHRTHIFDLMRGSMLIIGCLVLMQINMSRVYHFIRGQSMIKLYVLTSMMEVVDKLLSSFGQDVFDSLHWQTRHNPRSFKLFLYFLVVTVYVILHACLYFLHVATLTVVINSADETLLTVLILNNFSEMKSFVFKKFDSNNLFQLACADISERFQMSLFLGVILVVALAQAGGQWMDVLPTFARIALLMLFCESLVDSMKHAFINKFNSINAAVYQDFAYVLRGDILNNQKDKIILDHTYSVTRRLGLSQIPLGCVCVRYFILAVSAPSMQSYLAVLSQPSICLHAVAMFLLLVLCKIIVGVSLVYYASSVRAQDAELFLRSPAPSGNHHAARSKTCLQPPAASDGSSEVPSAVSFMDRINGADSVRSAAEQERRQQQERIEFMEELSSMERYSVYKGRVMG